MTVTGDTVAVGGAYDAIRDEVLERLERRRLRPDVDAEQVRAEVREAVAGYQRRAHLGEARPLADPDTVVEQLLRAVTDFGPLTDLLARRDVEEIFLEGARVSYLDGTGRLRGLAVPTSEAENRRVIERLLAATDRQLNAKHPLVQARVLGGTARLTAALPPVGDRLSATLRRYVVRDVRLSDLVARDSLTEEAATFLDALMCTRSRVTVSGEPGAGKTTMAGALLARCPRVTASARVKRSASWRCRSPTGRTTRSVRLASMAPARSACAISSSSCWRCVPTGSWSGRCAAPRPSNSPGR